ncbi:MAG: hypothetical protein M1819_005631 [Sarea resinae]|nr:MAG: hypothetical protein M1819_005631 [Sarea resinae]
MDPSLSTRLSLPFQPRESASPARGHEEPQPAERCWSRIQFLYYKDRPALNRVLSQVDSASREHQDSDALYVPQVAEGIPQDNTPLRNIAQTAADGLLEDLLSLCETRNRLHGNLQPQFSSVESADLQWPVLDGALAEYSPTVEGESNFGRDQSSLRRTLEIRPTIETAPDAFHDAHEYLPSPSSAGALEETDFSETPFRTPFNVRRMPSFDAQSATESVSTIGTEIWDQWPPDPNSDNAITSTNTSFNSTIPEISGSQASADMLLEHRMARLSHETATIPPVVTRDGETLEVADVAPPSEGLLQTDRWRISPQYELLDVRTRYEISRVAMDSDLSPEDLLPPQTVNCFQDPSVLWNWFRTHEKLQGKLLPRESSRKAWEQAGASFRNVTMSGALSFNGLGKRPMFKMKLNPLIIEKSFRYSRKFGNDRFLTLSLPNLSSLKLPNKHAEAAIREQVIDWLSSHELRLLGRVWRAFSLRLARKPKMAKDKRNTAEASYLIYFFAIRGNDIGPRTSVLSTRGEGPTEHHEISIEEVLDWHLPSWLNDDMLYTKAFQRVHLALSMTTETISFKPSEIIMCPDTTNSRGVVMNDGCAKISPGAARTIASALGLDHVPSAFQGRLGPSKGMWLVDYSGYPNTTDEYQVWIEMTDAQTKFKTSPEGNLLPHDDRLIFEAVGWSKPLKCATLNPQLISVLVNQGEEQKANIENALKDLLHDDLSSRLETLQMAMQDPICLRKWIQDNKPGGDTVTLEDNDMLGSLPNDTGDAINWFLEASSGHGFTPQENLFLRDKVRKAVIEFEERLKSRLHVEVPRSTRCYMLADPTGILEEGEVSLCFSTSFKYEASSVEDSMLCDMDVLVGRNPAHCPWDMQKVAHFYWCLIHAKFSKVHAVYKSELKYYKDVILFSSKGDRPLADILSGGDYDGDAAWVCWDPRLVDNFTNVPKPHTPTDPSSFGISRESETLRSLGTWSAFLAKGFRFNLQANLLGTCTSYHERLCHLKDSISTPEALHLSTLLDHLVDAPKQGYTFTETNWRRFLETNPPLSPYWPPKPAYMGGDNAAEPTGHIMDQLLVLSRQIVDETAVARALDDTPEMVSKDADLKELWEMTYEKYNSDAHPEIRDVLRNLIVDLSDMKEEWTSRTVPSPIPPEAGGGRASGDGHYRPQLDFRTVVTNMHERFMALQPRVSVPATGSASLATPPPDHELDDFSSVQSPPLSASAHALLQSWLQPAPHVPASHTTWMLMKASRLYYAYYRSTLAWWVAGTQLGHLKAWKMSKEYEQTATGEGGGGTGRAEAGSTSARLTATQRVRVHEVLTPFYRGMKLDPKFVKRRIKSSLVSASASASASVPASATAEVDDRGGGGCDGDDDNDIFNEIFDDVEDEDDEGDGDGEGEYWYELDD